MNRATALLEGYTNDGAGENLTFAAADYENFMAPRPEVGDDMEAELTDIVRFQVEQRWPIRIYATYNESVTRMLDVFESVNSDTPFGGLRIAIDHGETISEGNISRLAALGARRWRRGAQPHGLVRECLALHFESIQDHLGRSIVQAVVQKQPSHSRRLVESDVM